MDKKIIMMFLKKLDSCKTADERVELVEKIFAVLSRKRPRNMDELLDRMDVMKKE